MSNTFIKCCVVGNPVSQSRSPLIHGYWLKKYGIDGSYERLELGNQEFEQFMHNLPHSPFNGCNVTIPHKEAAYRLAQEVSDKARRLESANTIYLRAGKTCATSTDGEGFYLNLLAHVPDFDPRGKTALILGAGGSARAIAGELQDRGVSRIIVCNRTLQRAIELRQIIGTSIIASTLEEAEAFFPETDLLINTTSQGMGKSDSLELPLQLLPKHAVVCDIVYVPLKTALILKAEVLGLRTVTGLGMLLYQAVPGFELWFGKRPEVTPELVRLLEQDISGEIR